MKMPIVPRMEAVAQIENRIQNGGIPVFLPISFGVMKFESRNGMATYRMAKSVY